MSDIDKDKQTAADTETEKAKAQEQAKISAASSEGDAAVEESESAMDDGASSASAEITANTSNALSPKKVKIAAVVALLLCLCATALGYKHFASQEEPLIKTDSEPAAALLRDDSDDGKAATLEPTLFVNVRYQSSTFMQDSQKILSNNFSLEIDESACRKYYGSDGLVQCKNNWSFLENAEKKWATPAPLSGKWEEVKNNNRPYRYETRFLTPLQDTPGKADLVFTIPAMKSVVPSRKEVKVATSVFALRTESWRFFVDPQNPQRMLISGTITSNYPMDEKSIQLKFYGKMLDGSTAILGQPSFGFSKDKMRANVSVPVLDLPARTQTANFGTEAGVQRAGKHQAEAAVQTKVGINIPGQDVFVSLADIGSTVVTDDNLNSKQMLYLNFTRNVNIAEAQGSLKAKLLPLYRTDEDKRKKRQTKWSDIPAENISANILASCPEIELTNIPAATDLNTNATCTYAALPLRYMYVYSDGGASSDTRFKLSSFAKVVRIPEMQPELRFMQSGNILSLGGAKKLAVFSRAVDRIEFTAYRVRPEFINLLTSKSNGSFSATYMDESGYNDGEQATLGLYDISEKLHKTYKPQNTSGEKPNYSAFDMAPLLKKGGNGIFRVNMSGYKNNSHKSSDSRFVLVTDLGLNVKMAADGKRDIFVSSFSKGAPVNQAEVQILGRNGIPVFSKLTDASGNVRVPALRGLESEKEPVAILVKKGEDLTYMPIADSSRQVSLHKIPETQGRSINKQGLSAFVFAERGLFLPGESLRFGVIAKTSNWLSSEVSGLPAIARLYDPRGNLSFEKKFKLDASGLASIEIPMKETYPTGRYNLDVSIQDNIIGSKNVRVEEFKPDTLKLGTTFNAMPSSRIKGWLLLNDLKAEVNVANLYGTPAVGNRVTSSLTLQPVGFAFNQFKGYRFYNPGNSSSHNQMSLPEQKTDEKGNVKYEFNNFSFSGGTYRMILEAEGFETGGGRGVTNTSSVLVSPYDKLLAWKSNADLSFIAKDSAANISVVAVDNTLQQSSMHGLKLVIKELTYVSSLLRDSSGRYRYESVQKKHVVQERAIEVNEQGLNITLPTDKTGEFELSIEDNDGLTRCYAYYVVAGGSQRRFGLERDATLRVHLDKKEYKAGDNMRVFISAPYAGSGLITIEGDKVLAHKWFSTNTSDSVHNITMPKEYEGRAFVSVSMVRALSSDAVHSTPYSYAVTSFMANMDRRDMKLELDTPALVLPGETVSMKLKSETPGKAILFAVNEGVLQLTNYQTPSPLDFFLRRNPLGVQTMQNLDLLMPEFQFMNQSAFGGDMLAAEAMAGARLNPFRRKSEPSVVFWSGIIPVDRDAREVKWQVPDYFNGKLRIMAVAAATDSVGEAEKATLVRGKLIITPDLPVAVAPGDEFDVTLAIANNIEGSGDGMEVEVDVDLSDGLEFVNAPVKTVKIDEGREGKVVCRLRATNKLGEARMLAEVRAAGEKAVKRSTSLSIRPASPRMSSFKAGFVKGNEQTVSVGRSMYPQFASVESSVSGLPLPMMDALSGYLVRYPHGCTEQILSSAFPYALLHKSPELLPLPRGENAAQAKEKAIAAVNKGVVTMMERQVRPGRFSMWPQEHYTYSFLSIYGFDFLLSAREAGFNVPDRLFNESLAATEAVAQSLPSSYDSARTVSYAAWLYVRSGKRFTGLPQLVKHMDANLKNWRQTSSAAMLASCYKMMQQNKEADALIKEVKCIPTDKAPLWGYNSWYYNRLWDNGLQLTVISRYFPELINTTESKRLLVAVINDITNNSYTTPSATQAIRALNSYAEGNMSRKAELSLIALNAETKALPDEATGSLVKRLDMGNEASAFKFSGGEGLYWQITTDGFDVKPQDAKAKKLNITARYLPVSGKPLAELKQGEEVHVLLTASAAQRTDNIAITSLIPGGFEMVISKGGAIAEDAIEEAEDDYDEEDWSTDAPTAYPNHAQKVTVQNMLHEAKISAQAMDIAHVERREDRMVVFTSLDKQERVFIYRIKAINKGRYTLPQVFAEAMYDQDARANTSAGIIEVK